MLVYEQTTLESHDLNVTIKRLVIQVLYELMRVEVKVVCN